MQAVLIVHDFMTYEKQHHFYTADNICGQKFNYHKMPPVLCAGLIDMGDNAIVESKLWPSWTQRPTGAHQQTMNSAVSVAGHWTHVSL